jgi:hypothetical protein
MMKYRSIDRHLTKRVSIHGGLWSNMNIPQISIGYDQGCEFIGLSYGNEGCDAVIGISVDLAGTWLGKVVCETGWWIYRHRHAKEIGRSSA